MDKRFVYADNAATTRVIPEVFDAMKQFYEENYGNPSSIYSKGVQTAVEIDKARKVLADCLGARPNEIFITSGGSEADNWAIKGAAKELAKIAEVEMPITDAIYNVTKGKIKASDAVVSLMGRDKKPEF